MKIEFIESPKVEINQFHFLNAETPGHRAAQISPDELFLAFLSIAEFQAEIE